MARNSVYSISNCPLLPARGRGRLRGWDILHHQPMLLSEDTRKLLYYFSCSCCVCLCVLLTFLKTRPWVLFIEIHISRIFPCCHSIVFFYILFISSFHFWDRKEAKTEGAWTSLSAIFSYFKTDWMNLFFMCFDYTWFLPPDTLLPLNKSRFHFEYCLNMIY